MTQNVISIRRILRPMTGRSKAWLVQADDDLWYVTKFKDNPEGYRSLVNEFVTAELIHLLDVTTPTIRLLHYPEAVRRLDDLPFKVADDAGSLEGALHLGSQCPVNPEKIAIYDFMPRTLLPKVSNIEDFATMLVIDLWLNNLDVRQAVFFKDSAGGYRASFIDHGKCLGGPQWQLDYAPHPLTMARAAYRLLDLKRLTKAAVFRIQGISTEVLSCILRGVPAQWLMPGDEECLEILLTRLQDGQARLNDLVHQHLTALRLN